ncbi:MAG TPA: hypothetical protein VGM88_02685 [Kofleriaceae bacterium]
MRAKTAWVFVAGLAAAGCQLQDWDPNTGEDQQASSVCSVQFPGYTPYVVGTTQVKGASSDATVYVVQEDFNNEPNYVGALVDTNNGVLLVAYKVAKADVPHFLGDIAFKGHATLPGPVLPPHPGGTQGLSEIVMSEGIQLVAMSKTANGQATQCP